MRIGRRSLLKGLGAGLATGAAGCAPAPVRGVPRAQADLAAGKIDTIVLCMMENRSFDHYFGSLSLDEGRIDVDGLLPGMSNPDLDGTPIFPELLAEPCTEPDPPHSWTTSRTQFADGTNSGFVRAYRDAGATDPRAVMGYLRRQELPVHYALADGHALCQRWFSSLLTSTWPNRLYFHAAQNQGLTGNSLPPEGFYSCRSLWDQLDDAGIEWAYYFTDLPTLGLFARSQWASRMNLISDFYVDAAAGTLPRVVCVDAGASFNDDHPPHHPMLGQLFVGSIYDALARGPQWERSLFLVTYDEAGGFHDHVVPPRFPDDRAPEGFDQAGFRVPALVTGPWVPPQVDSTVLDHAAALTLVQDLLGLDERLTLRNEASPGLLHLLDADALAANRPLPPVTLPTIPLSEEDIEAECARVNRPTGQPELRDALRQRDPGLDRSSEVPRLARDLFRRTGAAGLWVPRS